MSILSSHAASWHSDKWYRRAWYIWPQVASLLIVGWVFAGVLLKPNPPWAEPQPPSRPSETQYSPDTDEAICREGLGYSRDAKLNACGRLIGEGADWPYFTRGQIYFRHGDYDRAIEDFSAFIHQNPDSDKVFNWRGLSHAKKREYDRAISDYTEAIRLNREPVGPYLNRGSAYEKKGELDKALADFREAVYHGSTIAPGDIKRIELSHGSTKPESQPSSPDSSHVKQMPPSGYRLGQECATGWSAQECASWRLTGVHNYIAVSKPLEISASGLTTPAVQLAGGHYEMPGYRWVSDDIQVGGKPYTRVGLVWAPVEQAEEPEAPKPAKYDVDGISLGARVSIKSSDYQEYQCTPSQQFEGVTWCNKQRFEEGARGSYRSSYTIAHSRDGTIYYLNRFLEPAFFNAGEVDNEIERMSGKFGEPTTRRIGMPRGVAAVDGVIATWGRVTLEPLDSTAINEWAGGRSFPKGILIDYIGNFSNSARWGLPIYRVSGGPGFVWAASFGPKGSGTLRFFAIDPPALLPMVSKERTEVVPPTNPQNDCDGLAANPSDRGKPLSVPGVPYDSLMNQARQAIEVCTLAAQQNPAELRYEYQLARAMQAEVPEMAVEIYKKLAGKGYPAAYDNLGWLMVKLYENYDAAITYFKTGSQLRDPDSMVSLALFIDRGYVQTDRPNELKYQLLRTAADLGHQGAQLQIREEEEKLSPAQRQAAQNLRIMRDFLGVR